MSQEIQKTATEEKKFKPQDWVLLIVAAVYALSPVDIVTDAVPIAGWFDDVFLLLTAGLNTLQKATADGLTWLSTIAKFLKWTTILIGIIVVGLILLLGVTIINLIHNW